jgi:hypothetical protein
MKGKIKWESEVKGKEEKFSVNVFRISKKGALPIFRRFSTPILQQSGGRD